MGEEASQNVLSTSAEDSVRVCRPSKSKTSKTSFFSSFVSFVSFFSADDADDDAEAVSAQGQGNFLSIHWSSHH